MPLGIPIIRFPFSFWYMKTKECPWSIHPKTGGPLLTHRVLQPAPGHLALGHYSQCPFGGSHWENNYESPLTICNARSRNPPEFSLHWTFLSQTPHLLWSPSATWSHVTRLCYSHLNPVTNRIPRDSLMLMDHLLIPLGDLEIPLGNADFLWFTDGFYSKGDSHKYYAGLLLQFLLMLRHHVYLWPTGWII